MCLMPHNSHMAGHKKCTKCSYDTILLAYAFQHLNLRYEVFSVNEIINWSSNLNGGILEYDLTYWRRVASLSLLYRISEIPSQ